MALKEQANKNKHPRNENDQLRDGKPLERKRSKDEKNVFKHMKNE